MQSTKLRRGKNPNDPHTTAMNPVSGAILATANAKSRRLRELVQAPEILVMPGAYDVLSALLFERLGFAAIQCTSGGIAAALGYADGEIIGRERFVGVTGEISAAVSVPVNADGERGYGSATEIGETVRSLVAAECAGMNLEDGAPPKEGKLRDLVDLREQLEKIAAVMDAKRELQSQFFLNARVDALAIMADQPNLALEESIRRANAYAQAGADCVFFLNAVTSETIARLVKEVQAPVSVLAGPKTPKMNELRDLGVARVSYGSAFLKAAIGAVNHLALEICSTGTISALKDSLQTSDIADLVTKRT